MKGLIKEELVFIKDGYQRNRDLLTAVSQRLLEKGKVFPSFLEKLVEREDQFPTGLDLGNYGVAIPHGDPEQVKEAFIAVVTLAEPVIFQSMADNRLDVGVRLVFILGLKVANQQLAVLQELMAVFQEEVLVQRILQEPAAQGVITLLEERERKIVRCLKNAY